ncbi:MAG: hypothetical protein ACFBSC_01095 [Microcoleaceae cyanobacterium]
MPDNQDNLRESVAKQFFESYDRQLLDSLREPKSRASQMKNLRAMPGQPQRSPSKPKSSINLSDLEEAIADIDSFLGEEESSQETGSQDSISSQEM